MDSSDPRTTSLSRYFPDTTWNVSMFVLYSLGRRHVRFTACLTLTHLGPPEDVCTGIDSSTSNWPALRPRPYATASLIRLYLPGARFAITAWSALSSSHERKDIFSMPAAARPDVCDLTEPALVGGVWILCRVFCMFGRTDPCIEEW